ncbi:MAG: hypothetical protein QOG30_2419 [Acidimicrobiaceae bacterium]
MISALLTGAGGAAARNVALSLRDGIEPYRLIGVDRDVRFLASAPVDERIPMPPVTAPDYMDRLEALVAEYSVDVVHPQPDVEVQALAGSGLPHGLPDPEVIRICADKALTNTVLANAGVPVPRAVSPSDGALDDAWRLLDVEGPLWLRATQGAGAKASLPVETGEEVRTWIAYWLRRGLTTEDFMISELLPGNEYAVQMLFWNGDLVGAQGRQRLEYLFGYLTPSGQTSSPSVARISNRSDLYDVGLATVRALSDRPHGVFSVDMKCDGVDTPKVTEVNAGRFFTTSYFLTCVGANFPDLLCRLVAGREITPLGVAPVPEDGRVWVRSVDMLPGLVDG